MKSKLIKIIISVLTILNLIIPSKALAKGINAKSYNNRYNICLNESQNKENTEKKDKLKLEIDKQSPQQVNTNVKISVLNLRENCMYTFLTRTEDNNGVSNWECIRNGKDNTINICSSQAGIIEIAILEQKIDNINDNRLATVILEFKDENTLDIKTVDYNFSNTLIYENKPESIVYHHAEGEHATPLQVNSTHKSNGWSGIGYHYYILKDGTIYRGRPENAIGAHSPSKNNSSIGICVEGDYTREVMPEAQKKAIINLSKDIVNKHPIKEIGGHKAFSNTTCPGINFPLKEIIQYIYQ